MDDLLCHTGVWGSIENFGGWNWGILIFSLLFWGAVVIGLILLVVWAIRRAQATSTTGQHSAGGSAARETLQARYARGEITREQFQLMQQDIG